jgi:hypothetical protein
MMMTALLPVGSAQLSSAQRSAVSLGPVGQDRVTLLWARRGSLLCGMNVKAAGDKDLKRDKLKAAGEQVSETISIKL